MYTVVASRATMRLKERGSARIVATIWPPLACGASGAGPPDGVVALDRHSA